MLWTLRLPFFKRGVWRSLLLSFGFVIVVAVFFNIIS